jgi:hypothetical protein
VIGIDIAAKVPNATLATFSLGHSLEPNASSVGNTSSLIQTKVAALTVGLTKVPTPAIPEPTSALTFAVGLLVMSRGYRRRAR